MAYSQLTYAVLHMLQISLLLVGAVVGILVGYGLAGIIDTWVVVTCVR